MSEDGFEDLKEKSKDLERYLRAFVDVQDCIERIEWEFVKQKGKELMEEFQKIYSKFNQAISQIEIENEAFHKGDIPQSQFEKKRAEIDKDLSMVDFELYQINQKLRNFIDKINDFIEKGGVVEEKKIVLSELNEALNLLEMVKIERSEPPRGKPNNQGKFPVYINKNDEKNPKGTNGTYISSPFTKIWKNISSKRVLIACAICGILVIVIYAVVSTPKVPVVMDFSADRISGVAPLNSIYFMSTVTGNPTKYYWVFEPLDEDWNSYHSITAHHSFHEPGIYNVSLTVENEVGSSTLTKNNYITVTSKENISTASTTPLPAHNVEVPVVMDFSADKTSGPRPLYVQFTSTVTGNPTSYYWVFEPPDEDWNSSEAITARHSFHEPGIYKVSLTVENESGSSTLTKNNYITVKG